MSCITFRKALFAVACLVPAAAAQAATAAPTASTTYFCESYTVCRTQFAELSARAAENVQGSRLWSERLPSWTDDMAVDFAFYPAVRETSRLLIVSSAIHGVEGYTGSAIQALFINEMLESARANGINVLMVHGINAHGFKHRKRFDENRVDLNRNWFASDTFPTEIDDHDYERFNDLFNPQAPAAFGHLDFLKFLAHDVAPWAKSVRDGSLTQAAGRGSYHHPEGIIFGGSDFEPHNTIVRPVLVEYLTRFPVSMVWDLHTGLGRREMQLLPNPPFSAEVGRLRKEIFEVPGRSIEQTGGATFYSNEGDFSDFVCKLAYQMPSTKACVNMLMEFGTLMPAGADQQTGLHKVKELRDQAYTLYINVRENQLYRFGARSGAEAAALEKAYDDLFFPKDQAWRGMVMRESRALLPAFLHNFVTLRE